MSRGIRVLAMMTQDDKWAQMKALWDQAETNGSDLSDEVYEYFCFEPPLSGGMMYKNVEHVEYHDKNTGVSYYSFSDLRLPHKFVKIVIVETP